MTNLDPDIKEFVSQLHCPNCQKSLTFNPDNFLYNFVCCYDPNHYKINVIYLHSNFLDIKNKSFILTKEKVIIYFNSNNIEVFQDNLAPSTHFYRHSQSIYPERILSLNKKIFDFQKMNENEILNKIQVILTFQ